MPRFAGFVLRPLKAEAMLRRYWLKFAPVARPSVLNLGCGITAYDGDDARHIFESEVAPRFGNREICEIIEEIDVASLDEAHVRPNMGVVSTRGVWFPLL
jgi:hypothetical protein